MDIWTVNVYRKLQNCGDVILVVLLYYFDVVKGIRFILSYSTLCGMFLICMQLWKPERLKAII